MTLPTYSKIICRYPASHKVSHKWLYRGALAAQWGAAALLVASLIPHGLGLGLIGAVACVAGYAAIATAKTIIAPVSGPADEVIYDRETHKTILVTPWGRGRANFAQAFFYHLLPR